MKPENEEAEQPVSAAGLLAKKHAAEQAILKHQAELVAERQAAEKRISEIDAALKATGWKAPRKPREKKC